MPLATRADRLPSLDGLRAFAVASVLIGHSEQTHPPSRIPSEFFLIFGNGAFGVLVFFCISGFLITNLLLRERERNGKISLGRFYVRRAFRILPALFAYLLFVAFLSWRGVEKLSLANFLSAIFFVTNYSPASNSWLLAHTWSLSIEEQFYLIWPLMVWCLSPRQVTAIGIALILSMPLVRVGTYFLQPGWRDELPVLTHCRIDALMFGCVAACASGLPWFESLYARACALKLHVVLLGFVVIVAPFIEHRWRGAYSLPVGWSLAGLAATLTIVWLVRNPDSLAGKVMNWRWLSWIGVMSYSLYLWQQAFMSKFPMGWLTRFGPNFVCAFIAAIGSYYLIEQPFLKLRNRFVSSSSLKPHSVASDLPIIDDQDSNLATAN